MYYFLVSLNNRNRFDTKVATESSEIPITSWVREGVLSTERAVCNKISNLKTKPQLLLALLPAVC